jgi:hypothetical protein
MALDKKQIALTVGGILAGLALTYLLYRLEQNNAATAAANAANASEEDESELANQQAEVASLPGVSVPTISSTPSTTDTTQQGTSPATDTTLEALIASMLGQDNSSTTGASTPLAGITALPLPAGVNIPAVAIPSVNTFSSTGNPGTSGGYTTATTPSTPPPAANGYGTNVQPADVKAKSLASS